MASVPAEGQQAPAARLVVIRERPIVLRRVPWAIYEALRDELANEHLRMDYLDGKLTIMSPERAHDDDLVLLTLVVRAAAAGMGLPLFSTGQATLRKGEAPSKGVARSLTSASTSGITSGR